MKSLFLTTGILLLSVLIPRHSGAQDPDPEDVYRVKKVVDGDTFWVYDGTEKGIKIRLIGVDTPETRKTRYKDVGYFGEEAKKFLFQLIHDRKIRLEYDAGRKDRYGRTLAYVYLEDGMFVNAELVKQGYARVMTVPPNVKYADLFLNLERQARQGKRGLWNDN